MYAMIADTKQVACRLQEVSDALLSRLNLSDFYVILLNAQM